MVKRYQNWLDKDFYSIEWSGDKKVIIFRGYFYEADASVTDNPKEIYRSVEYSQDEMSLLEYIESDKEILQEELDESVKYIGDMTKEEVENSMKEYFNGSEPKEMPLEEINMSTPCGDYVDYKEN